MRRKGRVVWLKKEKTAEKKKFLDLLFFFFLWLLYTAVTGWLFYHQANGNENYFHSDIKAYMLEMQGLDSGYSFPYPILFRLGAVFLRFLSPQAAITVALTLLNSLSLLVTKYWLNRKLTTKEDGFGKRAFVSILTVSLFLISMLFPVTGIKLPGIYGRYRGVFTPNPYHNATYLAARPFSVLCFFEFAGLLEVYEEKSSFKEFPWKKGLCFGLFLLLATMTKPSFTLVLVATAGILMVYRLIKSRFRNWQAFLCLGICFIPTFCDLLYQFFGVFVSSSPEENLAGQALADTAESGIGIGFLTAWEKHCGNVPLAILLALAFPIVVLVFHAKDLKKDGTYRLSLQLLLVSLFTALFCYEKGFRLGDMNFSWGYMYGIFFAFVGAVTVLYRDTVRNPKKVLTWVQWLFYLWHLGCGLLYMKNFLAGYLYY